MFYVIYHQWKWQAEDGMDMTSLNKISWLLDLRTFTMKCNYWIYCYWKLFDSGLSYKVVLGLSSNLILIMCCISDKFICSLVLLVGGHLRRLHQGPAGLRQPLVLASVRLAHLQSLHLLMVCVNIMTFSLLVWLLLRFHDYLTGSFVWSWSPKFSIACSYSSIIFFPLVVHALRQSSIWNE